MRGLIYKELYLSRKNWLIMGSVAIGFLAIEIMVMLSTYYGNLAKMDDVEDQRTVFFSLFMLLISIVFYGIFGDNGVTESDFKAKWHMFSYTLPVSEYKLAAIKVGKLLVGTAGGLLLSLMNLLILYGITDEKPAKAYVYYMMAVGLGFLLVNCITMPLIYRFRKESTAFLVIAVLYGVLVTAVMRIMDNYIKSFAPKHPELSEDELGDAAAKELLAAFRGFIDHWGWTIPLLIIAAAAVSYICTVRAMKRRGV